MNPLQFLSKTVTSVLSATESITKSRTSSTENWEKVGGDLSPTMNSPQNNNRHHSSSSDSLIDVDEISSISSDSEKNSAWLLPEGVTAVPHALTKIRTQFQTSNLSPEDKQIRENALTRLCIPTYVLNQSFPEKEQAEYEEKRRRHRESLTPKKKTNNFHTLPSQIVNKYALNSTITSDNETIRESESQNFEFSVDSESMETSFQNTDSNNNKETPEPAAFEPVETSNRRRVISVPQNLSTLSGSSINSSSHASIELKPQSSSKLKPSVGLKPQRRSPLPSAQLAAQKQAEDQTENSAENVTTSSLTTTLKPATRTRPSSRSRGVSPARISSRNQSPVNLVNRSKTTIDPNTPTRIPALKKPAGSRLPRPAMNRGNTLKFGFKPKKRDEN